MKLEEIKRIREEKRHKSMEERFKKHKDKTGATLIKEFKETGEYREIKLTDILIDDFTFQIRIEKLDSEKFDDLKESIKTKGLITPVYLRPKDGKYQILSGFNRIKACKELGIEKIKAIVKDVDDKTAHIISETENIQRNNLTIIDLINYIKKLEEQEQLTQQEIAERLNIKERQIRTYKAIGKDPKVLELVAKYKIITLEEAAKIANMPDDLKQKEINSLLKLLEKNKTKEEIKKERKKRVTPYIINPAKDKIKITIIENYKNKEKVIKLLQEILKELSNK